MADFERSEHVELWNRVTDHSTELSDLAKSQARTDVTVAALAESMEKGISRLESHLDELVRHVNRPPNPTNWFGMAAAAVALITLMGSFILLNTTPLEKMNVRQDVAIADFYRFREQAAVNLGRQEVSNQWYATWLEFLEKQVDSERDQGTVMSKELSELRGRLDMLSDQVQGVDNMGSRRWNKDEK